MSHREQFAQVSHDKWANERFAHKILAKKSKIFFLYLFYRFFILKMTYLLIPSKNEKMSESLFFCESLIRSFFWKKELLAQKTDEGIPSHGKKPLKI